MNRKIQPCMCFKHSASQLQNRTQRRRTLTAKTWKHCPLCTSKERYQRASSFDGCSYRNSLPVNGKNYGYISEHHSFGEEKIITGEYAEDLVATMLATTLGIELDLRLLGMRENRCIRQAVINLDSFHIYQTANKDGK